MRTIKASEVRKGMRVEADVRYDNGDRICIAGVVTDLFIGRTVTIDTENNSIGLETDHPVTVLAEPEPEWVEGAWYRVEINGNKTHAKRVEGGWVRWDGAAYPTWEDIDRSRVVTALGRVLIVDWPGDKWAADLDACNTGGSRHLSQYGFRDGHDAILKAVADAIRTQGGAP